MIGLEIAGEYREMISARKKKKKKKKNRRSNKKKGITEEVGLR